MAFKITVNIEEIAARLRSTRDLIENRIVKGVETLSIMTHAFILGAANDYFAGNETKRQMYLGLGQFGKTSAKSTNDPRVDQTAKHLRWTKVANGLWVVDLDPKAEWLETGGESKFMDWLLLGKSAKTAKDGTKYAVIPFKQTKGKGDAPGAKPQFTELIRNAARAEGVSLTKIDKLANGMPATGVMHKLTMKTTETHATVPGFFSKPRGFEEAMATGLPQHSGIYKLKGAVVTQRLDKKGKAVRETVVFRVISEKHRGHRWMTPPEPGAKLFEKANEFALAQWELMVKAIDEEINRT